MQSNDSDFQAKIKRAAHFLIKRFPLYQGLLFGGGGAGEQREVTLNVDF